MEMLTGKSSNLNAGPTDVAVLLSDHCQWRIWSTKQIYVNRVSDRRNDAKMIDTGSDSLHCHDTVTCQCWLERWLRAISMSADSEQHTSEYFACDMWQFDVWPPKRKKRREADLELFSLSNQKKKKNSSYHWHQCNLLPFLHESTCHQESITPLRLAISDGDESIQSFRSSTVKSNVEQITEKNHTCEKKTPSLSTTHRRRSHYINSNT